MASFMYKFYLLALLSSLVCWKSEFMFEIYGITHSFLAKFLSRLIREIDCKTDAYVNFV
jgi:hypothetical protein